MHIFHGWKYSATHDTILYTTRDTSCIPRKQLYFSRDKEGIIYSTKGMLRLLNNEYQCFTFDTQYGYHR